MASAHNIPKIPINLRITKKRFSFSLFSGGPDQVWARVHTFFETGILAEDDKGTLREVREVILKEWSKG